MNAPQNRLISEAEEARRRKVVSRARWHSAMEGLGDSTDDEKALDELWVTGQISREELELRSKMQINALLEAHGHRPVLK